MTTTEYWAARADGRMEDGMEDAQALVDELGGHYRIAGRNVDYEIKRLYEAYAKDYGLSYADAIREIADSEYQQWRTTLADYVERINETGDVELLRELDILSTRSRATRWEQVDTAIRVNASELATRQDAHLRKLLGDTYQDAYYEQTFDIHKGLGYGRTLEMLSARDVAKVVSYPWSGADFSARVWRGRDALVNNLRDALTEGLIQGADTRQMSRRIREAMDVAEYRAAALVRTEMARIVEQGTLDGYVASGIDAYEILATLDKRTSKICQKQDGKHYKVSEAVVGKNLPPFHVNCRTTTVAVVPGDDAQDSMRAARNEDGAYILVPADMTYEEWEQEFLVGAAAPQGFTFAPSKSIKGADDYARSVLGILNVSYRGCDVATANAWNEGLTDNFNRFPELKERFGFIGEAHERNAALKSIAHDYYLGAMQTANPNHSASDLEPYVQKQLRKLMKNMQVASGTYAQSWAPKTEAFKQLQGVTVNRNWGKDAVGFAEALAHDVRVKWHPVGTETIRSVLDHEIGHQLDGMLGIHKLGSVQNMFSERSKSEMTEALSGYGASSVPEMIAEAWAEYCNNPKPRATSKFIGETIEREYGKWKNKSSS